MGRALGAVLLTVVLQAQVTPQVAVHMNMVPTRNARRRRLVRAGVGPEAAADHGERALHEWTKGL